MIDIREEMAKIAHINGRIWAKIYNTKDYHDCKWEELSEYHRELYKAGADMELEILNSKGLVIKEVSDG